MTATNPQPVRGGAPRGERFDIPILLPLAFWTSLSGIVLERSRLLAGLLSSGNPFAGVFSYLVYSFGSFLLNFAALLSIILVAYYLVSEMRAGGAMRTILAGLASLTAGAAVAAALIGLVLETTVATFLTSQLLALMASFVLMGIAIGTSNGPVKITLVILPVASFLLLQANQLGFFFPHLLSLPGNRSMAPVFLLAGQTIFLAFAAVAALHTAAWNRRKGLPLFIPFLVAVSVLFVSAIAIVGSEKARTMFFRIVEAHYILPYSFVIHPLVFALIFFTFSMLIAGSWKNPSMQLTRKRTGYGLGFVTLGTFTPATSFETVFLLLGMILWIQSISRWKD